MRNTESGRGHEFGTQKKDSELAHQVLEVKSLLSDILYQERNEADSHDSNTQKKELLALLAKLTPTMDEPENETDTPPFRHILSECLEEHPELSGLFNSLLKRVKKNASTKIRGHFERITHQQKESGENPELAKYIEEHTIWLGQELTESHRDELRKTFPSGNYLYFGAKVNDMLAIIESGRIRSAEDLQQEYGSSFSRGGQKAISLSLNEIHVLPGTHAHLMGLITSPEAVLDETTQLQVPTYRGGLSEVRLHIKPSAQHDNPEKLFPEINIESGYIVVSHTDLPNIKKILLEKNIQPQGILVMNAAKLRNPTFRDYTGDHNELSQAFQELLSDSQLTPTIAWTDLFPRDEEIKMFGKFVHSDSGRHTACLVGGEGGTLNIDEQCKKAEERPPRRDPYDGLLG